MKICHIKLTLSWNNFKSILNIKNVKTYYLCHKEIQLDSIQAFKHIKFLLTEEFKN
jgi:hypothetical protein